MTGNESGEIKLSTKEGYDRWAEFYDADDIPLAIVEEPWVDEALGNVSGLSVLDLGCGTGRQSLRLAAKGAKVTGLDQSTGMLAKAREKDRGRRVDFREHDVDEPLPFPDESFDRVVSFLALEHVKRLVPFFAEARRVCRGDGFLLFTAMHPAMLLKGVQARFTDEAGRKVYPEGYPYRTADYLNAAIEAGLTLKSLYEGEVSEADVAVSDRSRKYAGWPLLLGLVFERGREPG